MTTTTPTPTPTDAIGAALSAHPGATAAELAEVAGIGRSTAARCLAALEQTGTARRTPGGRKGGRRLPDRWHLAVADTPDTPPAGEGPDAAPAGDGAGPVEAAAGRLGKGALGDLVLAYLAARRWQQLGRRRPGRRRPWADGHRQGPRGQVLGRGRKRPPAPRRRGQGSPRSGRPPSLPHHGQLNRPRSGRLLHG